MPKEYQNPKPETTLVGASVLFDSAFGLWISFGIRHSAFGFMP
jgi:hypothetical protein